MEERQKDKGERREVAKRKGKNDGLIKEKMERKHVRERGG